MVNMNDLSSSEEPQWFYWSQVERNADGETIAECLDKYGTGGWTCGETNMQVKLIYLDATRSDTYSWLLWVKRFGKLVIVSLHEEDPHTYKVHGLLAPPPH
jgi:hypothetical protein